MIAKSYNYQGTEIVMTKNNNSYNLVRIVKGKESNIGTNLEFEDANDAFDFYIDMERDNDK